MDNLLLYAAALLPSIGVGYIFYVVIKNLLEGDRNERLALARLDRQEERAAAAQEQGAQSANAPSGQTDK